MPVFMGKDARKATQSAIATTYTLTVKNENSQFQQFALYQTIPEVVGPNVNATSLAWMVGGAAPGTPSSPSVSTFSWEMNYAAIVGYLQNLSTPGDNQSFLTSSSASVGINSSNSLGVTYDGTFPTGAPAFPSNPTSGTAGEIIVISDTTIPTAAVQASEQVALNVGIAIGGNSALSVQLEPNLTYQFTPNPTYYILSGTYVQGQVINMSQTTAAYKVVFDGVTNLTIIFNDENQFAPA